MGGDRREVRREEGEEEWGACVIASEPEGKFGSGVWKCND